MHQDTVLIVDSDPAVVEAVRSRLIRENLQLVYAYQANEGIHRFLESWPQVIVLRAAMPGMPGWAMAERLREMSDVPILFILDRADRFSVERALHLGDDFITPPWNWDRLAAKLLALLRRGVRKAPEPMIFDDGRLRIDFAGREVRKDGKVIRLTDTEFKLLSYMVRNPDRTLKHDELLVHVWGHTYLGARSYVSLYIRYLRKKIEDDPSNPAYFCTDWGLGYSFRPHASLGNQMVQAEG